MGRQARKQAKALLHQLKLGPSADAAIGVYSGGMRRRLIFAQACLGSPKILALDEPTAELDAESATAIALLVNEMSASAIVLVSTHNTDHFAGVGARSFRVDDGRVAQL